MELSIGQHQWMAPSLSNMQPSAEWRDKGGNGATNTEPGGGETAKRKWETSCMLGGAAVPRRHPPALSSQRREPVASSLSTQNNTALPAEGSAQSSSQEQLSVEGFPGPLEWHQQGWNASSAWLGADPIHSAPASPRDTFCS